MPRSPLPVGTWGKIRRAQVGPGKFTARTHFRDYDGITRKVEAWGRTGAAAQQALLIKLRDRTTPSNGDVTPQTRVARLAELWLEEITAEGRLTPQTIDNYKDAIKSVVLPALGALRLSEVTVSRLDRMFKVIAAEYPGKARLGRVVVGQILGMAVRHDALSSNPVRDIGRLAGSRRPVRALSVDDLHQVRDAIRRWQTPAETKPGPRHSGDLADIVDMMLATGGRIGEILAIRWVDLDLTVPRPTLVFSGTLVRVKGQGLFRQDWTKTDAGYRMVTLPRFAVDMLQRRRANAGSDPAAPVFPSRRGTWLSPNNVRRQWRDARKDTGLEWVTPHTFRKTVGTLLDREANTKTAAAQLGHSSEEITATYYVQKLHVAPDVSGILEVLGTQR